MIDGINGLKYGMEINTGKIKIIKFTKDNNKVVQIKIGTQEIENVNKFRYLGVLINNDGRDFKETKPQIGMTKNAFSNLSQMVGDRTISLDLRKKVMECYVWSVMKYSCETWTMSSKCEKKISAFEMWCYH